MSEENSKIPLPGQPEPTPDFLKGDEWFGTNVDNDFLDFDKPYRPPRYTMERDGVPFADVGELHIISGKPGNGKTGLMSQLEAATLGRQFGNTLARNVGHIVRDEQGNIVRDKKGKPMMDKKSKDTEIIPFRYEGGIEGFFQNEILPYSPDAWIDPKSIETGYELSFTKYFYKPNELRSLSEIRSDIRAIEERTDGLIDEIVKTKKVIAEAVTKGLNPNVKMKDSGISWIGMIPEHWETKRIASLFTGKVKANTDFKYHHAFKFYYGTLVPKDEVGDIEEYRETYVKYSVLQKDDIMINGLNLNYDFVSQRVALAPSDGIITSAYVVVRPRKGTNAQYYNYLFKTMDNMKLFHGMGTGIRLTLSFDELKKQLVVVPPQDEQHAIVAYIDEKCQKVDTLITELQAEIDYLKEYKQRLIADVVTGQVNVQN